MRSHFPFSPCRYCCAHCIACKDKQYPDELTVTFAGVQNGDGCNDCTAVNAASWVLHRDDSVYPDGSVGCHLFEPLQGWQPDQSNVNYIGSFPTVNMCTCAGQQGTLSIFLQVFWNYGCVPGCRAIRVKLGNDHGCLDVEFFYAEDGQTEPFDCAHFAGSQVLQFTNSGAYCASPGATCTVSA